jgi:hypothetical protein
MPNGERGKIIGVAGLIVLFASWIVLFFPWRILPPSYLTVKDPSWVLLVMSIFAGSAGIAGIAAGRTASKWWYLLSGAGFLTAAVLLADLAV